MDKIRLKNYRCFRDEQTARLAPLTLLVGENSTGKTSFLAITRILLETVNKPDQPPDFKKDPYDLGSFDDIAHHRGGRGGRSQTFEAGLELAPRAAGQPYSFDVAFKKSGTVPVPARMRLSRQKVWVEVKFEGLSKQASFGTSRGAWKYQGDFRFNLYSPYDFSASPFFDPSIRRMDEGSGVELEPITLECSGLPTAEDWKLIEQLIDNYKQRSRNPIAELCYASAPVRSEPRRTYDPSRSTPHPQGAHVPMYLASLYFREQSKWKELKKALEDFGRAAGLFDEISIKPLGRRDADPFQVQVRKFGGTLKGPKRNLIDMGYGVSQVLPLITELLRLDVFDFPSMMFDRLLQRDPSMFLLQQPEVHLHPSAQAALGSLFCNVASGQRQLVIETHSDHLLDRVRMDVRDGAGRLKPEDVSILYFERRDLGVRIHSLRLDEEGNVLGAPDGYRNFFLEETARSLWKRLPAGT